MQMFCKFKSKLLRITKINLMQKVKEKKKLHELRIESVLFDDCMHSDFVHSIFHSW